MLTREKKAKICELVIGLGYSKLYVSKLFGYKNHSSVCDIIKQTHGKKNNPEILVLKSKV